MKKDMHAESKNLVKVTPAVLPHTWQELEEGLQKLLGVSSVVQIDVVKDIFAGRESLPMWEECDFEFDIYIEPGAFVARAVELGAQAVVVHVRHATCGEALQVLQEYRGGDFATMVGLALQPTDTPEALAPYAGLYDYVQVMGIDNEGKQGEPFDPRVVELVRTLRAAHPALMIQVDGAAAGHIEELVHAGAQCIVVGSAIIRADNPKAVYKEMYNKANALGQRGTVDRA